MSAGGDGAGPDGLAGRRLYDAGNMGLARPDSSLYADLLGTRTVLPGGAIAFAPSTNLRIGSATRALVAADNSCTWIARIRSPGGLTGISGMTLLDTDGKVWCFITYPSSGELAFETDLAAALVFTTTGANNLSVGDDMFWKVTSAAGAATSTARALNVFVSSNPTVWPSVPTYTNASFKLSKVGIGSIGSTGWHGIPLLLGESIV